MPCGKTAAFCMHPPSANKEGGEINPTPRETLRISFVRSGLNIREGYTLVGYIHENPFIHSLSEYKIVVDRTSPDIIFHYWGFPFGIYRGILGSHLLFGSRPVICINHSEIFSNIHSSEQYIDYMFSYHPKYKKNYQKGLNLHSPLWKKYVNPTGERKRTSLAVRPQKRFCNFVYRNDRRLGTHVRRNFCRELMRYKPVDCPGKSLQNMPPITKYTSLDSAGKSGVAVKIDFLASYKFTIAFENRSADFYTTEKIVHPFLVGSIPIYWGCPQIAEYFNPQAFVNCHDFTSFAQAIEQVKEIDNNPRLYKEYLNAPILLPHSKLYELNRDLLNCHRQIAQEAIARRTVKESIMKRMVLCLGIISSHWQLEIGNAARRLIGQQIYPVLVTLLRGFLTSVGIRDTGYEKIRISYHRVARGLKKKISG